MSKHAELFVNEKRLTLSFGVNKQKQRDGKSSITMCIHFAQEEKICAIVYEVVKCTVVRECPMIAVESHE